MTISDQIKHGMALAFFASAYADQADECDRPLRGEIMDQLPDEIDAAALRAADTLAHGMYVTDAGCKAAGFTAVYRTLHAIYSVAEMVHDESDGDRELTPELFGHYCAMQAMGHGVGLESFGRAVRDAVHVPYVEFGSCSLRRDYFGGPTRVVFRAWRNGDVIALFPDLHGTNDADTCESYMHVGQHSAADYRGVIRATRPATEAEAEPLKRELESAPFYYNLRPVKRK